tara:strand:- start:318 stop:623 length:306 start_codon:yes stop_codon:yes gene_type:complete
MHITPSMSSVLENYCYSKKISDEDLNYLEKCWLESLNRFHYNRFPSFAPAIVCDVAGVSRGSYWIICNAAILDFLRPLDSQSSRLKRISSVLTSSGVSLAA